MNGGYAKLYASAGEDERIGILAETNPLGLALFLLSISKAYPYGVLPGSPRAYRAAVIASAVISEADIEAALEAQEAVGLIERYERDGQAGVYLREYHRYQDVQWFKVRRSEVPLPEDWAVPDALADAIHTGKLAAAHRRLGKFGIEGVPRSNTGTEEHVLPCSPGDTPMIPNRGVTEGEQRGNTSTATVTDTVTDTALDVPAVPSAGPSLKEKLVQLRRGYDQEDLDLIDEYLDFVAAANKGGTITLQRRVNLTQELTQYRDRFGEEPWRYGMRKANAKSAEEGRAVPTGFIRACIEGWTPPRASPPPLRRRGSVGSGPYGPSRSGSWDEVFGTEDE
jgi:hypothetical protein